MAVTLEQLKKFVEMRTFLKTQNLSEIPDAESVAKACGFTLRDMGTPVKGDNFTVWSFVDIHNKQSFMIEDMNRNLRFVDSV